MSLRVYVTTKTRIEPDATALRGRGAGLPPCHDPAAAANDGMDLRP